MEYVVIALLTLALVWVNERARSERDALTTLLMKASVSASDERERLQELYADERRELLTRIQHPQLLVTKAELPVQAAAPDVDEWDNVGKVLDLVEVDEDEPNGD